MFRRTNYELYSYFARCHGAPSEPEAIKDLLGNQIDLIIDGGNCGHQPTTVIDLTSEYPVIIREGKGDPEPFK